MNATAKAPIVSREILLASPSGCTIEVIRGKKITGLVVSRPQGKHRRAYISYEVGAIGLDQLVTALLDWHYVDDELPDDETTVMIASADTDEPGIGFHSGDAWYYAVDASPVDPKRHPVYAWAHVPGKPPQKEGQR